MKQVTKANIAKLRNMLGVKTETKDPSKSFVLSLKILLSDLVNTPCEDLTNEINLVGVLRLSTRIKEKNKRIDTFSSLSCFRLITS